MITASRATLGVDLSPQGVGVAGERFPAKFVKVEGATTIGDAHFEALASLVPLRPNRFGKRPCALSLPHTEVRIGVVRLPQMHRAELRKVMAQESFWRDTLRLEGGDFDRWWSRTKLDDGCRVRMAAVERAATEPYVHCTRRCGLEPRLLVVALPHLHAQPDDGALVWLDPATPCIVSGGGAHPPVQALPCGAYTGADDAERVAGHIASDAAEVTVVCTEGHAEFIKALRQRLRASVEVRAPFESFKLPAMRGASAGRFALFVNALRRCLRASVEARTPSEPSGLPAMEGAPTEQFALARACAARSAPLSFRAHRPLRLDVSPFAAGAVRVACVTAAVALPVVVGLSHATLNEYAAQMAPEARAHAMLETKARETAAATAALRRELNEHADKIAELERFSGRRDAVAELLNTLGNVLPPGIRLRRFEFFPDAEGGEPMVRLTGLARHIGAVSAFAERIRGMPGFGDVRLDGLVRASDKKSKSKRETQERAFEFVVECMGRADEEAQGEGRA